MHKKAITSPVPLDLLPPQDGLRPGADYTRESEWAQGVYSEQTQREHASAILLRHGFYVAMHRHDEKTGSKVSRRGYQEIVQAVESGQIEAVGGGACARKSPRPRPTYRPTSRPSGPSVI